MSKKQIVGNPDLMLDWLEKYFNMQKEINEQLLRGLKQSGKGLSLDQFQSLVEHRNPFSPQNSLSFGDFWEWLKENDLEQYLPGGFVSQVSAQQKFYRRFYGNSFCINRSKISISADRLPAIKAGLKTGAVNYAMVVATPPKLTTKERQMTEAEFAYHKLLASQKRDGLKIWAETGRDRWTNLTLEQLLQDCILVEPENFNIPDLQKDWEKEIIRVAREKGSAPRVIPGKLELVFTNNQQDLPADQTIINTRGEVVEVNDKSFVNMIASDVPVLAPDQSIILKAQAYYRDKTYLSRKTWEWQRAVVLHNNGKNASASGTYSDTDGVYLGSFFADVCNDINRFRLAL